MKPTDEWVSPRSFFEMPDLSPVALVHQQLPLFVELKVVMATLIIALGFGTPQASQRMPLPQMRLESLKKQSFNYSVCH